MVFSVLGFIPITKVNAVSHTRDEAVNWANEQIGKYIDADNAYGNQCVDLIMAYYQYLGVSKVLGNGYDYAYNSLPAGWTRIQNTPSFVPEPGDIVVWTNQGWENGHVAIFLSGNTSSFDSIDQNWPIGSSCKRVTHNYNYVWGVIRPDFSASVPSVSNPWISVEKATIAKGETINFSLGANNATSYTIGIDRNGSRVITQGVGNNASFVINDAGDYSAYVTCANSVNSIDSGRVYFTVIDPANLGDVFYSKIIHTDSQKSVIGTESSNVQIATQNENNNQVWRFERQSDNSYKIINIAYNKCLDLSNSITDNGNNIGLCNSNDCDAQRWYIINNGNGYSLLSKCNLSKALDLENGNVVDGNNIHIYNRNNTAAQIYTISKDINSNFYSPSSVKTFNNHKYEYYDYSISWKQAESICNLKGGHLVTITSQEEQNFVNNLISDHPQNCVWAGATDEIVEDNWMWVTGEIFSYTNWAPNEPNNTNSSENFLHLNEKGKWNDINENGDSFKFGFICEYEDIDETKYTPVKSVTYNDNTYEIFNDCVTWEQAKKICKQKGGHLVTIENTTENNMISDNIALLGKDSYLIGCTDREKEGTFSWITNEKFIYSNWNTKEPNN